MYNAQEDMLFNFKLPKGKGSGDMSLQYSAFAFNESMTVAEGILEFQETVLSSRLQDQFESLGATCITIATFQNNDGNHSAASALNRVIKLASSPGFRLIKTGVCNAKLLAKAAELAEKDKVQASGAEFDEKTQAAIRQSLADINGNMATKEELQHLGESSQKSSEEIKSKVAEIKQSMASANDVIIANLSRTIFEHEKTIKEQQLSIENLEKKNYRQSCVLAKLNAERDETARELKAKDQRIIERDQRILKLQEENHSLKNGAGLSSKRMEEMLTDLWEESKRRRA